MKKFGFLLMLLAMLTIVDCSNKSAVSQVENSKTTESNIFDKVKTYDKTISSFNKISAEFLLEKN